ncbi:MAG: PGPGW domain-containing protein [Actinomadura sp.]
MTATATRRAETETLPEPPPRRRATVRVLRKIAVTVAGTVLIVAGVAMLVLPGPGIVSILAGLGLLGTEFPTARRVSERVRAHALAAWRAVRTRTARARGAARTAAPPE